MTKQVEIAPKLGKTGDTAFGVQKWKISPFKWHIGTSRTPEMALKFSQF